jgi:predicted esterase
LLRGDPGARGVRGGNRRAVGLGAVLRLSAPEWWGFIRAPLLPAARVGPGTLGYGEYLPPGYGDGEPRPLLVFLHGGGEYSDGSTAQLPRILKLGIPSLIETDDWPNDRPFIVLMPQYPAAEAEARELADEVEAFLKFAVDHYEVDMDRVYLTGVSCGGIGLWDYLASHTNELVAATVPIAAHTSEAFERTGCELGRVPIWAFHGGRDEIVPVMYIEEPIRQTDDLSGGGPRFLVPGLRSRCRTGHLRVAPCARRFMTRSRDLEGFEALVGSWQSVATHPSLAGVEVPGSTSFEWLEGGHYLIGRSRNEHADFPDSLLVIGAGGDGLVMHYFDSRGVERTYGTSLRDGKWRLWRDDPDFAQRFVGKFEDGGSKIGGQWEVAEDGGIWKPDLRITYHRAESGQAFSHRNRIRKPEPETIPSE